MKNNLCVQQQQQQQQQQSKSILALIDFANKKTWCQSYKTQITVKLQKNMTFL